MHKILVIDDDSDIRTALRLVLTKAGYQPLLAEGGPEAIELLKQRDHSTTVSTILCDLDMPGMDGAAVVSHMRTHYPKIPIVVLSGAPPTQFLSTVGQEGVGDWIRKPATNDEVLEKVRVAVHLYELRKKGS